MNSDFSIYLTYALIAAAAFAVVRVIWSLASDAGVIGSETRDFANNARDAQGRQKTQLERFVEPGTLFRQQVFAALIPALVVPALFVLGGLQNPWFLLVFAGVVAFAGWQLPRLYWNVRVKKRQLEFESKILDFAVGVANALKAGMALPQAFERISKRSSGAMAEELAIVQNDYRLGTDMPTALDRLVERMPCEDMRLVAASVRLTTQTGGSLAEVLAEMAEMIRGRRDFADKVKSLTAQSRFEGWVLGTMPVVAFLLFNFIQPELMSVLYTTVAGWCALGAAAVMEAIGFVVIGKITKIEV